MKARYDLLLRSHLRFQQRDILLQPDAVERGQQLAPAHRFSLTDQHAIDPGRSVESQLDLPNVDVPIKRQGCRGRLLTMATLPVESATGNYRDAKQCKEPFAFHGVSIIGI